MLHRIAEGIYYTPCSERTDRPNLGYVRGSRLSIMVDAGNSPSHAAWYMSSLKEAGLPRPDYVFLTHHHWDHTFGLAALDGVKSIAGSRTNDILREMSGYAWSREDLDRYVEEGRIPLFCKPHILLEYPLPEKISVRPADISFEGELRLDLGGETVRMKRISSSHTDECYYLLCEKAKVLFLGDGKCEECVGTDWIDRKAELTKCIDELEAADFRVCLTGHFPPETKETLLEDLRQRLANL